MSERLGTVAALVSAIVGAVSAAGAVLHWLVAIPTPHLVAYTAIGQGGVAFVVFAQLIVQAIIADYMLIGARHLRETELRKARMQLNRLLLAVAATATLLLAESAVLLGFYPSLWLQLGATSAVAGVFVYLELRIVDVAQNGLLDLPSGSEALANTPVFVKVGARVARVPGMKTVGRVPGRHTAPGDVSWVTAGSGLALACIVLLGTPEAGAAALGSLRSLLPSSSPVAQPHGGPHKTSTSTTSTTTPSVSDTTSTPIVTTPSGSTTLSTTTEMPQPIGGYTDYCSGLPGDGAAARQKTGMFNVVLGTSGTGGAISGCIHRAERVQGQPGLYYATGTCGTELRSVILARPDGSAVIVIQQPARFVLNQARAGTLIWASARQDVDTGNVIAIDTTRGVYVFIRAQSANGPTAPTGGLWCDQFQSQNVDYSVIPPGLVVLWVRLMDRAHDWIWVFGDDSYRGEPMHFVFEDWKTRSFIARATCPTVTRCTLRMGPQTLSYSGEGVVTSAEYDEWAPPSAVQH